MEIVQARGWPHEEVSFRLEKGYVTPNCMGRAVRQFEKEVSFKPEEGVENVTSNCMGRAVCQFDKEVSFLKTRNRSRICYIELYGKPRPLVRKEVSFRLGTGVEYVSSNCMGRSVRQFEKEVSFILETGVGYVTSNCMGRAVRHFDKEVSFKLGTGVEFVI